MDVRCAVCVCVNGSCLPAQDLFDISKLMFNIKLWKATKKTNKTEYHKDTSKNERPNEHKNL